MTEAEITRFWPKVQFEDDGCWRWLAAMGSSTKTYGVMGIGRSTQRAHRLAYEHFVGPIPEGHELHHKCGEPGCVNPDHLDPLTRDDHARAHVGETCSEGHPLSGDNLYLYRGKYRRCRECGRVAWRKWNAKRVTLQAE